MEKNISYVGLDSVFHSPFSVCVVIPTYNERKNIRSLLDRLHFVSKGQQVNSVSLSILFVDDNSPDNTADAIKNYQSEIFLIDPEFSRSIHLLEREKKDGLGAAYIAGFNYALSFLNPDVLIEMDADLSHNPEYIPFMLEKIYDGADLVIGSRYVAGGKTPDNWGVHRKFASKAANFYTDFFLHMGIKDCTAGFKAIRSDLLKKIDLSELHAQGYVFQIAIHNAAVLADARIEEIPITFTNRKKGSSKLAFKDILELLFSVPIMWLRSLS